MLVGLVSGPSFRITTRSNYLCLLSCFEGNVQDHKTEPKPVGFGGFQIQHELTPEGFELYAMPIINSVWIIWSVCFINYSSINASWKVCHVLFPGKSPSIFIWGKFCLPLTHVACKQLCQILTKAGLRVQELKHRLESARVQYSGHMQDSEASEELLKIHTDLVTFHGEVVLMENYSALNYTGK
jgi:hypothetical protein